MVLYNLFSSFVIWKAGPNKAIRILHEDFVENPTYYIKRIGELINEDLDNLEKRILEKRTFEVSHLLAGAEIRKKQHITIRPVNEQWKKHLNPKYKIAFLIIAGWLARIYGYKL